MELLDVLKQTELELTLRLSQVIQLRERQKIFFEKAKKLNPYLNKEGQKQLKQLLADEVNEHYFNALEEQLHTLSLSTFMGLRDMLKSCSKTERLIAIFLALEYSPSSISKITGKSKNAIAVSISRLKGKLTEADIKMIRDLIGYNCLDEQMV